MIYIIFFFLDFGLKFSSVAKRKVYYGGSRQECQTSAVAVALFPSFESWEGVWLQG
jgi:hypothetical protein